MIRPWGDPKPRHGVDIAKAVTIAALSAAATGLVTWGIDMLKARFKKPEAPETDG